ncbi:MAG: zinc metalloprotease HtpX [Longimicrobiales bacterium]
MMFVIAAVMNFSLYWWSDKMVLRMYKAQIITPAEAPELYATVDRLRQRAGLPMPVVAISPQPQPNAFATGRDPEHAVVCCTAGILKALPQDELEGVIAHELAHIKHRHMLVSTIAATMAGAIGMLGRMAMWGAVLGGGGRDRQGNGLGGLVMLIISPFIAMIIQFAISRQNEFQADATAAEITGRPMPLANALTRLDAFAKQIPMDVNPAAAHLAIVNPLAAFQGQSLMRIFSTHPPTAERVARLKAIADGAL